MENKSAYLEVAIKAARAAGEILEKHFETEILKNIKEDESVVTIADGEAEEVIKKIILETFPDHSILGEETGLTENGGGYKWHIDPIDGTRNFANGIPLFAVSIALVKENEIIVGVIYNPVIKSLFYAERGKGTYMNNKRIFVSKGSISNCIIAGGKGRKPEDRKLFRKLMHDLPQKISGLTIRDFGSCVIDLSFVARGGIEASISLGLHTYDFAAGVLLIQEAGGVITGLDGGSWKFPDNYFIASNGVFHDLLVAEVKGEKARLESMKPEEFVL